MDKSCWTCGYHKADAPTTSNEVDLANPPTLLGKCHGWIKEKGMPMPIEAKYNAAKGRFQADIGCSRWVKSN